MTDLRQLANDLDQLREEVDYLITLVEPEVDLATGAPLGSTVPRSDVPSSRAGRANAWHTLTLRETGHAWDVLTEWVDWLLDRYCVDDTVPDCWYRHGAMTDELDALRAAWVAAYLDPHARPFDAAYWHDLLDRALTRLRNWDRYGCSSGTHHDDTSTPSGQAGRQARTDHLRTDIDIDIRARRQHSSPRKVRPDDPGGDDRGEPRSRFPVQPGRD
jgi:hypothetical protein